MGVKTWPLISRKEQRPEVCENRLQRPKREEESGDSRKIKNKELHSLYSPLILRVIKRRMR
jgi:hypothetical protein